MDNLLNLYATVVGAETIDELKQLAEQLQGLQITHVNSTPSGGGVAEILSSMIPLMRALGIDANWQVLQATNPFFECTKGFHNALQGNRVLLTSDQLKVYEEINSQNADRLKDTLNESQIVVVHDPQPAALIRCLPSRKGKWIWRCHIDASKPYHAVWKYLSSFIGQYDASIFSLLEFAKPLPHPIYIIPPSIDPLSDKNRKLSAEEVEAIYHEFALDPKRPFLLQVSRFDRFKDPLGVVEAYRLVKKVQPDLQLVFAGSGAADDPEGQQVLEELQKATASDANIHLLLLPPDANLKINALQRAATIVLQKSVKEGFGLTVTEGLWKSKPVIGGNTGGIKLQIHNRHTGFIVNTPEGAAYRIRYLLQHPEIGEAIGHAGREYVREKFLITRHVRDYLCLTLLLLHGKTDRLEL